MIKEGAAIIDVGINHIEDPTTGRSMIVGDVDLEGKHYRNDNTDFVYYLLTTTQQAFDQSDIYVGQYKHTAGLCRA